MAGVGKQREWLGSEMYETSGEACLRNLTGIADVVARCMFFCFKGSLLFECSADAAPTSSWSGAPEIKYRHRKELGLERYKLVALSCFKQYSYMICPPHLSELYSTIPSHESGDYLLWSRDPASFGHSYAGPSSAIPSSSLHCFLSVVPTPGPLYTLP
jgi:hypothetical protein